MDHFLDSLQGKHKVRVVLWSSFAKKRFYVFETMWNRGMASYAAYRNAHEMTREEVKKFYNTNHLKIKE